ncbi:MAG: phosphotransferase [Candidatus Binatia bacterium]
MTIVDEITEVRQAHGFDELALADYLATEVEGFAGPVDVKQFKGGQSNPTFLLATPGGSYVLRKKPPGKLLRSAHRIDREYRVMKALAETNVPVPAVYCLCEDDAVIGTAFYVMELVEGRVFRSAALPDMAPQDRAAVYDSMNRVLADLHNLDLQEIGLENFGRKGNYFERQISRWSEQYRASQTVKVASMDRLMDWLPRNIPPDSSSGLAHGDFRLENAIYHPTEPRMIAVLDWELSTVGHPLADLAYNCMGYHIASPTDGGLTDVDFTTSGIPDEKTYVERYRERTRRPTIDNWNFYLAFSMFRLGAIAQGVYKRGLDGNASSDKALQYEEVCRFLADKACHLLEL